MCIYALFTFPSCSHPAFVAHSYCPELQEPGGPLETRPTVSPYGIQMLFADDKTLLERSDFVRKVQELEPAYFCDGRCDDHLPAAISQSMIDLNHGHGGISGGIGQLARGARSMVDLSTTFKSMQGGKEKQTRKKKYNPVRSQRIYDVALAVAEANNRKRLRIPSSPSYHNFHAATEKDQCAKRNNRETRIIDGSEYAPAPLPSNIMSTGRREANIPEIIYEEDEECDTASSLDTFSESFASSLEEDIDVSEIQRNAEMTNAVPATLESLNVRSVQYHVIYPSCKRIELYRVNGWPFLEEACGSCAKKAWRVERATRGGRLIRKKSSEMLGKITGGVKRKLEVEEEAVDGGMGNGGCDDADGGVTGGPSKKRKKGKGRTWKTLWLKNKSM